MVTDGDINHARDELRRAEDNVAIKRRELDDLVSRKRREDDQLRRDAEQKARDKRRERLA